jgi:hypothetical protein
MNLKLGCSFISTTPAGTEALTGDTNLQIPDIEAMKVIIQETILYSETTGLMSDTLSKQVMIKGTVPYFAASGPLVMTPHKGTIFTVSPSRFIKVK